MNILIIDKLNRIKLIFNAEHIPRLGDCVNLGYKPFPKVMNVVWYPDKNMYNPITTEEISVLILTE